MSYFDRFKPLSVDSMVDTGDQKSDDERSLAYEHAREELEKSIVDLVGEKYLTMAKVLSYFPKEAELFIKTQKHAQEVSGKSGGIWFIVKHEKDGPGLDRWYSKSEEENLKDKDSFYVEDLINFIEEINNLRGKGWRANRTHYAPYNEILEEILKAYDTKESLSKKTEKELLQDLMSRKALEVMNVNDQDISLIRNYVRASRESHELKKAAQEMMYEATKLEGQASDLVRQASNRVDRVYPRPSPQ